MKNAHDCHIEMAIIKRTDSNIYEVVEKLETPCIVGRNCNGTYVCFGKQFVNFGKEFVNFVLKKGI